jgi:beta-glucosidase
MVSADAIVTLYIGPDMNNMKPGDFIWASGIEDTFVPQTRPGARALDEYQLMGHYQHWREDLALVRELGIKALRWGVPWYRVEPFPGEFDWRWMDQVIPYLVEDLRVVAIIDLMHYGCPFWLYREFASDEYPRAVAAYAAAFARRYSSLIHWYTPLNEPFVNAWMGGKRGRWPPYLHGDGGLVRLMVQLARGILNTVEAIKSVDSSAIMVHVEASGVSQTLRDDMQGRVDEEQAQRVLSYDLVSGKVTRAHVLFRWLTQNGVKAEDLDAIARQPVSVDILGLNFYPQWSTKQVSVDSRGRPVYRIVDREGTGFSAMIETYYRRYGVPIMITETSARGATSVRSRWLETSLAAVKRLREQGIPIIGYTWFPMYTMIDWRYRYGRRPVEDYRLELGFYSLNDGDPRWRATPLVDQWRGYVADPARSIGVVGAANPGR